MSLAALDFLVGSFAGTERVHATQWGPARDVTAQASAEPRAGGTVLVGHHDQLGDPSFAAINVFMADPATGEILLYSFDSYGFPPDPPARGTWEGEELVLDRVTGRGASRTVYAPTSDGYRWSKSFAATAGGPYQPVVEGELARS